MGEVWYIENSWTCPTCYHKNQGRHMDCQNCGARREAGVEDEMPSDVTTAPRVVDPKLLEQARAGAHWECEFCGGQERDLKGNCQNCGGDREPDKVKIRPGETFHLSEPEYVGKFRTNPTPLKVKGPSSERPHPPITGVLTIACPPSWWQRHKRNVIIAAAVAAGLGALTWLLLYLFIPKEVHAKVDRIHWQTTTVLKQRVTKRGEGWNYPAGAFDTSCHRRQRGTENCHPYNCNPRQESYNCRPHECNCTNQCTSQNNGYSRCERVCSTCYDTCYRTKYETCYQQCPVYDDWCTYKYYEWPVIKKEQAQGRDHKVYWPEIAKTGQHQRIEKSQTYEVCFRRDQDLWTHHPKSLDRYKKYTQNDPWLIKVNRAGQIWPLQRLTAEAE